MPVSQLPGCVIVNGMPGSGKTTVTRIIAGLLPRAALLRAEYVAEMVVSGMVWALGEPRGEARRQQLLANRNMCMLANNFAANSDTCGSAVTPSLGAHRSGTGEVSRQYDILLIDRNAPRLRDLKSHRIVPAETVFGVIEVKSRIDGRELRDVCSEIAAIKRLPREAYRNLRPEPMPFRPPRSQFTQCSTMHLAIEA